MRHTIGNKKAWDQDACLTEAVSKPYHRFFLDLDLLFAHEHESVAAWNTFVRKICLSIGKAVLSCYPDVATTQDPTGQFEFTVICTKGYRAKTLSQDRIVFKRGIHVVWPRLIVDTNRAECLARAIDEFLTKDVPRDLQRGENAWKDAVDISVYKSGLRPVGCAKISPCSHCRPIARKRAPVGMSYEISTRFIHDKICHPPAGFVSRGEESTYSLEFISRGDGIVFSKPNFKLRLESHVLKDGITGKEFDFSLMNLTSIRSADTEPTPGFLPPSHLRCPLDLAYTDYRVHAMQDPETGDYVSPPKRRKIHDLRNSHELILGIPHIETMTRILQTFHPRYSQIIIDKVWAFPTRDPRKMLPALPGEAPKRSLYSHLWLNTKGKGSYYCHNKPGHHNGRKIRFHLDFDCNLYQSCWSLKSCPSGKPCCRVNTKGKQGFMDTVMPGDFGVLVEIFTTPAP